VSLAGRTSPREMLPASVPHLDIARHLGTPDLTRAYLAQVGADRYRPAGNLILYARAHVAQHDGIVGIELNILSRGGSTKNSAGGAARAGEHRFVGFVAPGVFGPADLAGHHLAAINPDRHHTAGDCFTHA